MGKSIRPEIFDTETGRAVDSRSRVPSCEESLGFKPKIAKAVLMFSTEAVGSVACWGYRPVKPGSWWRTDPQVVLAFHFEARDRAYRLFVRSSGCRRPSRSATDTARRLSFTRRSQKGRTLDYVRSLHGRQADISISQSEGSKKPGHQTNHRNY